MAFVDMKCKSCGATLRVCDGYLTCDYCGSVYFRLSSDGIPDGAENTSLEEFLKKIDENTNTYCVNCSSGIISDADADLTASKLKAASKALENGEFYKVDDILKGLPRDMFAAARLRLLAAAGATSETQLCFFAGDLKKIKEYEDLLSCADDENNAVYSIVEQKCLENEKTVKEIAKGHEFLRIGQYADGLKFAEETVRKHPFFAKAWELLIKARCLNDEKYDPVEDLRRLQACPDASFAVSENEKDVNGAPYGIDATIKERCRITAGKRNAKAEFFNRYLLKPVLVLIALGALIGIWKLIEALIG